MPNCNVPVDVRSALPDSTLSQITMAPDMLSISFRFERGPDTRPIEVCLRQIAHISLSKTLDDDEGCANVFEASMVRLDDGGLAALSELAYGFRESGAPERPFTYPNRDLFRFHIEGDVCADVVCGDYDVVLA
jgi:hypothetical protein